jgi:hypothetical protein
VPRKLFPYKEISAAGKSLQEVWDYFEIGAFHPLIEV